MKLTGFLIFVVGIIAVSADCGCLKCSKNLRIISPPNSPIKVVLRGPQVTGTTFGSGSYLTSSPVLQMPEYYPATYEFKVQAPLAIPSGLEGAACIAKPIKGVARVDRIVIPAPSVHNHHQQVDTVYTSGNVYTSCGSTSVPVTNPVAPINPAPMCNPVHSCSPCNPCNNCNACNPCNPTYYNRPTQQVIQVQNLKPIKVPIIEAIPEELCGCNYRYDSHKHFTDATLDRNIFNPIFRNFMEKSQPQVPLNRVKRSLIDFKETDIPCEVGHKRCKRSFIATGLHFLFNLLPGFIKMPLQQGLRDMQRGLNQQMMQHRKVLAMRQAQKMRNVRQNPLRNNIPKDKYHPYHQKFQQYAYPQKYNIPPHLNKKYLEYLQNNYYNQFRNARSGVVPITDKVKERTIERLKGNKINKNTPHQMNPEEMQVFLKKLQRLNGPRIRNKRSIVFDSGELSVPFFRVTDLEESEESGSVEVHDGSSEEYSKEDGSEETSEEESDEDHSNKIRKRYRKNDDYLKPLNFKSLIPQNPIFYFLNTPIRFLRHFHSLQKRITPVLQSFPEVFLNSKKYILDLGKNFENSLLNLASNVVGDFEPQSYGFGLRNPSLVKPRRYRRDTVDQDKFRFNNMIDYYYYLLRILSEIDVGDNKKITSEMFKEVLDAFISRDDTLGDKLKNSNETKKEFEPGSYKPEYALVFKVDEENSTEISDTDKKNSTHLPGSYYPEYQAVFNNSESGETNKEIKDEINIESRTQKEDKNTTADNNNNNTRSEASYETLHEIFNKTNNFHTADQREEIYKIFNFLVKEIFQTPAEKVESRSGFEDSSNNSSEALTVSSLGNKNITNSNETYDATEEEAFLSDFMFWYFLTNMNENFTSDNSTSSDGEFNPEYTLVFDDFSNETFNSNATLGDYFEYLYNTSLYENSTELDSSNETGIDLQEAINYWWLINNYYNYQNNITNITTPINNNDSPSSSSSSNAGQNLNSFETLNETESVVNTTVRQKRYILKVVGEDEVEDYIKSRLRELVQEEDEKEDKKEPKKKKKKCKHCTKSSNNEDDDEDKKPNKTKYRVEKLSPKLVIDNNGKPFIEVDGAKRPLGFIRKKKHLKKDSEESKESEEKAETKEESESVEEIDIRARIGNLIEKAKKHAEKSESETTQMHYSDVPPQIIKEKISQTLTCVQDLVTMDFDDFTLIYNELLRLEQLKNTITDEWKQLLMGDKVNEINSKIRLLDYFQKLQITKDEVLAKVAEALKNCNNFMSKKLIKMLIRLQKLQCIIVRIIEDFEDSLKRNANFDTAKNMRYIDYLCNINFIIGSNRKDLEEDLKFERDQALEKQMALMENLRKLLENQEQSDILNEEAKLLWEIKNLEKLQQDAVEALNNRISQNQKIRKELKILFDILGQLEVIDEKQCELLKKCNGKNKNNHFEHHYSRNKFEDSGHHERNKNNLLDARKLLNSKRKPKAIPKTPLYKLRNHPVVDDKKSIRIISNGYPLTGYKPLSAFG